MTDAFKYELCQQLLTRSFPISKDPTSIHSITQFLTVADKDAYLEALNVYLAAKATEEDRLRAFRAIEFYWDRVLSIIPEWYHHPSYSECEQVGDVEDTVVSVLIQSPLGGSATDADGKRQKHRFEDQVDCGLCFSEFCESASQSPNCSVM